MGVSALHPLDSLLWVLGLAVLLLETFRCDNYTEKLQTDKPGFKHGQAKKGGNTRRSRIDEGKTLHAAYHYHLSAYLHGFQVPKAAACDAHR